MSRKIRSRSGREGRVVKESHAATGPSPRPRATAPPRSGRAESRAEVCACGRIGRHVMKRCALEQGSDAGELAPMESSFLIEFHPRD